MMINKIKILLLSLVTFFYYANQVFASFTPPVLALEENSSYDINFTVFETQAEATANGGNGTFIYYELDLLGNIIPTYYSYKYELKSGVVSNNRIDTYTNTPPSGNINSPFINKTALQDPITISLIAGGAIYNSTGKTLHDINADFIGNNATTTNAKSSIGGAIANSGIIGNITGDFIKNYASSANSSVYSRGGAIYNNFGKIGNIDGSFIGNYNKSSSTAYGGAILNNQNTSEIGNITGSFIGNHNDSSSTSYGGAIYNGFGKIGDITGDFIGNYNTSLSSSSNGGAIFNSSGKIGNITGGFVGNYNSSSSSSYGGAIYNSGGTIENLTGNFINNSSSSKNSSTYGGAIYNNGTIGNISGDFIGNHTSSYIASHGGAIYEGYATLAPFIGSNNFIGNYAKTSSATISNAKGGAIYLDGNTSQVITFAPQTAGNGVLFQDNYTETANGKKLNSIYFNTATSTVNFLLQSGTYADIRDSITGNGIINKDVVTFYKTDGVSDVQNVADGTGDGLGKLLLWGDNSEFTGKMNIKTGDFYLMFDENDPDWAQRHTANLNNATVTFGNDTVYRPRVSSTQLASLNSATTTVGAGVTFLPYDLSSLNVGDYTYTNDYSKFDSWESELAKVDTTPATSTDITIKRDLEGYDGLSALADAYRKQNNLSYEQRDELDYLYMTGIVSDDLRDMFGVIGGNDVINFEETHRTSIRQFSRQLVSRIQNRNCPECGIKEGYKDEHLWFNMGQNFIEKDSSKESLGYKYNPTSIAIGYDQDFIPKKLNLGVALGYATGEAKTSSGVVKSTNEIDEYLLSLYGKYKPSSFYVSGAIGGGLMTNDTKFVSSTINTKGEYNTKVLFANSEVGNDFCLKNTMFTPYVGAEYTKVMSDSHSEKGTGARHFGEMDWDIFETPLGLRLWRDIYSKNYIITPMLDVAYAHNFGDTGSSTRANFVGNASDVWKVSSSSEKRDSFRGNANIKINNLDLPFALNLGYSADYRSDYTDQQVYGTIRYDF